MSKKEIVEMLERTLRATEDEATESEATKPVIELLLVDLLKFHGGVTARAGGLDPAAALEAYSQAFASLKTWADKELERARARPIALRERQRTLDSVINYVRSVDSQDTAEEETGT